MAGNFERFKISFDAETIPQSRVYRIVSKKVVLLLLDQIYITSYYSIKKAFWCMKSANYKIFKLRILRKSIRLPIRIGIQLLLFYQYLFYRSHHKMTLKVDDARSEVKHFLKLSLFVVYVLFLLPPMMFQMVMAFDLSIKQSDFFFCPQTWLL